MNIKKLFRNWKIWLLIICILMAIVSIWPNPWADGVAIRSVTKDSAAALAGFQNPKPTTTPMGREVVHYINNVPIKNIDDYASVVSTLRANMTVVMKTSKDIYRLTVKPLYETIILNETEVVSYTESYLNQTTNETVNITGTRVQNKTLPSVIGVIQLLIQKHRFMDYSPVSIHQEWTSTVLLWVQIPNSLVCIQRHR